MENGGLKVSLPGSLHFGVPGENGATFVPFISNDGDLSWSNDKGLENPPTVNIRGPKGETGDKGEAGTAGKSAYEYARDGGYDGTEAQFSAKLAQEIPYKTSQLENDSHYMTEAPVTSVNGETGAVTINVPAKTSQLENDSGFVTAEDLPESSGGSGIHIGTEPPTDASVEVWIDPSEEAPEIGGSTQNAPLTFTGAVSATYDGTEAVSVEIPSGGGSGGSGGGNVSLYKEELTLTENVKEYIVNLPCNPTQVIQFSMVIVAPSYDGNTSATYNLYVNAGGNINISNVPSAGSIVLHGVKIGDAMRVTGSKRTDQWYNNCVPYSTELSGNATFEYDKQLKFFIGTTDNVFPVGTKFMFWGMYSV